MSLWRPYIADVPLDVSTTADRETQCSHPSEFYPPQYALAPYYLPHSGYTAPVEHISPGGSSSEYVPVPFNLTVPQQVTSPLVTHHKMVDDSGNLSDDPDFVEFERKSLEAMAAKNGGTLLSNKPQMRRQVCSASTSSKNEAYRRQRERNNLSAKQSRDRRTLKEFHSVIKVDYLKKEVAALEEALKRNVCGRCRST